MSSNKEPGSSRGNMSVEEQAREFNKPFWRMSQEEEEAEDELYEPNEEEEEGDDDEDDEEGDDEDDGGETGDGGGTTDGSQSKKQRKDRQPNVLGTMQQEVTEVSLSGIPKAPSDVAKGYANQVACILRDSVSINTKNLRGKSNKHLVHILLNKLHLRYKFPKKYRNMNPGRKNAVNNAALSKMSKALSSWKSRVKQKILDGESFEQVNETDPMIDIDEFTTYKTKIETDEDHKKMSLWGKTMREQNIGNHRLGSGGYRGIKPTWEKEDALLRAKGMDNPWDKFAHNEQVYNFIRARYSLNEKTMEFETSNKEGVKSVADFEQLLVRN